MKGQRLGKRRALVRREDRGQKKKKVEEGPTITRKEGKGGRRSEGYFNDKKGRAELKKR